jgi:hypothetical protein
MHEQSSTISNSDADGFQNVRKDLDSDGLEHPFASNNVTHTPGVIVKASTKKAHIFTGTSTIAERAEPPFQVCHHKLGDSTDV